MDEHLDRFRTSLKATLWCWALYWPGGGLLLLYGGLDPLSLLVVGGSLTCFLLLLAGGALDATSSRNIREFLLERPLYLVALLIVLLALVPLTNIVEDAGLLAFSALFFASVVVAVRRLMLLQQARGGNAVRAGTDEAFLALAVGLLFSAVLFVDTLLGLSDRRLPMGAHAVAFANWLNLVFPGILLLGTRRLREPLRNPFRRRRAVPEPSAVSAQAKDA
ncbi:MAG TPA: hypothetical protein VFH47_04720 [Candidatus Thermoplasmatota archaeon]|nr:hypothetical protein [Candidatus Thermoplasmatota archaeon]